MARKKEKTSGKINKQREIEKKKGTQFDPQIADVFLEILKNNYDEIEKIQNRQ